MEEFTNSEKMDQVKSLVSKLEENTKTVLDIQDTVRMDQIKSLKTREDIIIAKEQKLDQVI